VHHRGAAGGAAGTTRDRHASILSCATVTRARARRSRARLFGARGPRQIAMRARLNFFRRIFSPKNITCRVDWFDSQPLCTLVPRPMPISERAERAAQCTLTTSGAARPISHALRRGYARVARSWPVFPPRRRPGIQVICVRDLGAVSNS